MVEEEPSRDSDDFISNRISTSVDHSKPSGRSTGERHHPEHMLKPRLSEDNGRMTHNSKIEKPINPPTSISY